MDRFSFDDSIRFEEDSLCSWSSEAESLCNNWRGWKKPTTGNGTSTTTGTVGQIANGNNNSSSGTTFNGTAGCSASGTSANGVAGSNAIITGSHCARNYGKLLNCGTDSIKALYVNRVSHCP